MIFEWDEGKRQLNLEKHGVDFAAVKAFDWETALTITDERKEYQETRLWASGYIGKRLYVVIYTRRGDVRRLISMRKANRRERILYEAQTQT